MTSDPLDGSRPNIGLSKVRKDRSLTTPKRPVSGRTHAEHLAPDPTSFLEDLHTYQAATEEFAARLDAFVQRLSETLVTANVLAVDPASPYRWLAAKLPWGYSIDYWPYAGGVDCRLMHLGNDIRHYERPGGNIALQSFITDLERGYMALLTAYACANKTARRDMLRQDRPDDPE